MEDDETQKIEEDGIAEEACSHSSIDRYFKSPLDFPLRTSESEIDGVGVDV